MLDGTQGTCTGAAVVSVDDWDQNISDWAVANTPIFGSNERALEASDNLKTATTFAMVGTALAVPNGLGAWETKPCTIRPTLSLLVALLFSNLTLTM